MKTIYKIAMLLIIVFATLSKADEQTPKNTAVGEQNEQLVKSTTDTVTSFYKVLLQKEEPTIAQEKELFNCNPSMAVMKGVITDKMQIPATEPGILQVFRTNKELFLPVGMKSTKDIIISSPFQFVRNLERYKDSNNLEYDVIALLAERRSDGDHFRTVFFSVVGGKINPDAIRVGGYDGPLTLELALKGKLIRK